MWYLIVSIPDLCNLTYFSCVFVTFPYGAGQVWYLIVSIPDLFLLLNYDRDFMLSLSDNNQADVTSDKYRSLFSPGTKQCAAKFSLYSNVMYMYHTISSFPSILLI